MLSEKLLNSAENFLSPIGVWPNSWNHSVILFNVIVLTLYAVLVNIKNILNPEGESIENAITLSNGGLVMVSYFVILLIKKEKSQEMFNFVKNGNRFAMTIKEMEVIQKIEREFKIISTTFLYFLPPAVLVRFVMPSAEYAYIKVEKLKLLLI